jgi:hypothetical protein
MTKHVLKEDQRLTYVSRATAEFGLAFFLQGNENQKAVVTAWGHAC